MKENKEFKCATFKEAEKIGNELFKDNISVFIFEVRMKNNLNYPFYIVTTDINNTTFFGDDRIVLLIKRYNPEGKNLNLLDKLIDSIKLYFQKTNGEKAVIGISGGKDSTVAAALCVKALGKENVIGVLMPNGEQKDINDSRKVCEFLGIKNIEINISDSYYSVINKMILNDIEPSIQTSINLAPRLRMATLYAIAQSVNGRVINTSNACELFVGYGTLWGDTVGDFAPLKHLTVDKIYEIGDQLELPYELVHKTPSDGLTGKSDEENLGVSYSDIGLYHDVYANHGEKFAYIHLKEAMKKETFDKIQTLHKKNEFKADMINIPSIDYKECLLK